MECAYCYDVTGEEVCQRTDDDWVIGWDGNVSSNQWFVVREGGSELSEHATHNDALRHALAIDPHVQFFHEADGGGCLGSFDPNDSPYNDADETY